MLLTTIPLALLAYRATAQTVYNDQPPANDSATEPYWPRYPEGTSEWDFTMSETSNDADLRGESRIAQWIVTASNVWRAQFGSQPVTWNETAARIAQEHVNTCRWEHWGSDNLAQLSYSEPEGRFDVNPMIEMWAEEWDYYPFRHPEAQAYSHFTAMTWNASNTLGCAWNVGCANVTEFPSMTFFVCHYWPQGNIATQPPGELYAENIGIWQGWSPEEVPDVAFTPAPSQPSPTRTLPAAVTTGTANSGPVNSGSSNNAFDSGAERVGIPVGIVAAALAAAAVAL